MQLGRRGLTALLIIGIASPPALCRAEQEDDAPDPEPLAGCAEGVEPCVRPHPARIALASAGLGALATGVLLTFIAGDRTYTGDPNYLLVGGGAATMFGALMGQLASISGHEFAVDGAVTRPVFAIGMTPAGWAAEGDVVPPIPTLRFSPALQLDRAGSTLRLDGLVGVQAGMEQRSVPGGGGEADAVTAHEVRLDLGPELAVALPYPVADRPSAPRTGAVELRYAPRLRVRRHEVVDLEDQHEVVERITLLPLNLGIRWHLSGRQQFELLVGPRWDTQTLARNGEELVPPGPGQANNFYGEIWYRVGVPFRGPGPLQVTGELALGYEQWKGDHQALDFGTIVGYLGPLHLDWTLHLRRPGDPLAVHVKGGAIIARGGGAWFEVGVARAPLSVAGGAR